MASDSILETPRPRRERLFDSGMVMTMLVVFFIGFWPSFIFRKPDFAGPPLTPLIHLHAANAIGWLLMLLRPSPSSTPGLGACRGCSTRAPGAGSYPPTSSSGR